MEVQLVKSGLHVVAKPNIEIKSDSQAKASIGANSVIFIVEKYNILVRSAIEAK